MTVDILTFGCRLNTYESEVMRDHAAALTDTVIVNTCAVTGEAERQARQAIRRLHRERPDARIVVTGCAAQIAPDAWASLPGVTRVLGNAEKLKPESWAADAPSAVGATPAPVAVASGPAAASGSEEKPKEKSAPRPVVQTVTIANTTVQKPVDQVIQVSSPKGQTLVCR